MPWTCSRPVSNNRHDLESKLQSTVDAAAVSLPGMTHAGITIAHRDDRFETRASSVPLVRDLDDLQYHLGEGPCVYAMEVEKVVTVKPLRRDQRWPNFIPAAVALGLKSQMGLQLHAEDSRRGIRLPCDASPPRRTPSRETSQPSWSTKATTEATATYPADGPQQRLAREPKRPAWTVERPDIQMSARSGRDTSSGHLSRVSCRIASGRLHGVLSGMTPDSPVSAAA
jgi:hypothetical protein